MLLSRDCHSSSSDRNSIVKLGTPEQLFQVGLREARALHPAGPPGPRPGPPGGRGGRGGPRRLPRPRPRLLASLPRGHPPLHRRHQVPQGRQAEVRSWDDNTTGSERLLFS